MHSTNISVTNEWKGTYLTHVLNNSFFSLNLMGKWMVKCLMESQVIIHALYTSYFFDIRQRNCFLSEKFKVYSDLRH